MTGDIAERVARSAPLRDTGLSCDRYYTTTNFTQPSVITAFEGIPDNICISVALGALMLIAFAILRRNAYDYGISGLLERTEDKHIKLRYAQEYNVWSTLYGGDLESKKLKTEEEKSAQPQRQSIDTVTWREDKNLCHWLVLLFRISDEDIIEKTGHDGVHFQMFQRYLIMYMAITCAVSIIVIMPINITQGNLERYSYGKTTMSNIHPNSPILSIHCITALLMLVLCLFMMRNYHDYIRNYNNEQPSKTLMVTNIAASNDQSQLIVQHFEEAYPEASVVEIHMAYNVRKLRIYDMKRRRAADCMEEAELTFKVTGRRPLMIPVAYGAVLFDFYKRFYDPVDTIEYYETEFRRFDNLYKAEKEQAAKTSLGIAFVTFSNPFIAERIYKDFRVICCSRMKNLRETSVSDALVVNDWQVRVAPEPEDINWHHLNLSGNKWLALKIVCNGLVFLFFFLLTTPTLLLNKLNYLLRTGTMHALHPYSLFVTVILPNIILATIQSGVPDIVEIIDYLLYPWFKDVWHRDVLIKTYVILMLSIMVLPSIGLASLSALFEWISAHSTINAPFRWKCVFESSNHAFFVNFIFAFAFVSSMIDLMRFPDIIKFVIFSSSCKSRAELSTIRQKIMYDYPYGMQYSTSLFIFTVCICYSLTTPLITVAGLVCLITKYYVDRYNMFFSYVPSKISMTVHRTAINIFIISVVLMQLSLFAFIVLRGETLEAAINIFALVALILTVLILLGTLFLGTAAPDHFGNTFLSYNNTANPSSSDSALSTMEKSLPQKRESTYLPDILHEGTDNLFEESADGKRRVSSSQRSSYGSIGSSYSSAGFRFSVPPSRGRLAETRMPALLSDIAEESSDDTPSVSGSRSSYETISDDEGTYYMSDR